MAEGGSDVVGKALNVEQKTGRKKMDAVGGK